MGSHTPRRPPAGRPASRPARTPRRHGGCRSGMWWRVQQPHRRQQQQPIHRQRPQRRTHHIRPALQSELALMHIRGVPSHRRHHQRTATPHPHVKADTSTSAAQRGVLDTRRLTVRRFARGGHREPPLRRRRRTCGTMTVPESTSSRRLRARTDAVGAPPGAPRRRMAAFPFPLFLPPRSFGVSSRPIDRAGCPAISAMSRHQ